MNNIIRDPFFGENIGEPDSTMKKHKLLIVAAIISFISCLQGLANIIWGPGIAYVEGSLILNYMLFFSSSLSPVLQAAFPCCFAWVYRKNNKPSLLVLAVFSLIVAVLHAYYIVSFPDNFLVRLQLNRWIGWTNTLAFMALWSYIAFLCMKTHKIIAYLCFVRVALPLIYRFIGTYIPYVSFTIILVNIVILSLFIKTYSESLKQLKSR